MPTVNCFQRKMLHLFSDLDLSKVYLDSMLIQSYNEDNHLDKLNIILNNFE